MYRLSGAENDWKPADAARTANYSLLSPGSYVFYVKAADLNGNWGPEYKLLAFTIVPYFWQTNWFKAALITAVGFITFYFFRKRINGIRHEAEMKQRIAETEMMALRAQMNPHFIFNCINSIDALIQSNDKYQANIYLNKFARLIRNILDSSKQNVVALSKDLETLQLYTDLEQFRTENKFGVNIKAEISLLQDDYKIPPLIIQPFVENAILHGLKNRVDDEGMLCVSVTRQDSQIEFIVEDNGVGREATRNSNHKETNSYGMQMSEERVKIFNNEEKASVFVTDLKANGQPSGTRVRVLLNIK
jgi:LytS/YehU family sensor histidine kinase